ncbi:unnamed protein product, partial [Laminaria digitata]
PLDEVFGVVAPVRHCCAHGVDPFIAPSCVRAVQKWSPIKAMLCETPTVVPPYRGQPPYSPIGLQSCQTSYTALYRDTALFANRFAVVPNDSYPLVRGPLLYAIRAQNQPVYTLP